jgi:hypothetical protein
MGSSGRMLGSESTHGRDGNQRQRQDGFRVRAARPGGTVRDRGERHDVSRAGTGASESAAARASYSSARHARARLRASGRLARRPGPKSRASARGLWDRARRSDRNFHLGPPVRRLRAAFPDADRVRGAGRHASPRRRARRRTARPLGGERDPGAEAAARAAADRARGVRRRRDGRAQRACLGADGVVRSRLRPQRAARRNRGRSRAEQGHRSIVRVDFIARGAAAPRVSGAAHSWRLRLHRSAAALGRASGSRCQRHAGVLRTKWPPSVLRGARAFRSGALGVDGRSRR